MGSGSRAGAEVLGITRPATFGKVIGGGLPVGASAGAATSCNTAPIGGVYQPARLRQCGGHVSWLATLRTFESEDGWRRRSNGVRPSQLAPKARAPYGARLVRAGSLFWLSLQDGRPPRSAEAIDDRAAARFRPLFHVLLDKGVALAPSAYEVGFLSLAHSPTHIARLADALEKAFASVAEPS